MKEKTRPAMLLEETPAQAERNYAARAFAASGATSTLAPISIRRREPGPRDVQIEILYCGVCGVCHSDLHQVRDEWHDSMPTVYPCVPGHEIVGRVTTVGSAVKNYKVGDIAAVGCMVGSCGTCASCLAGEEQYCDNVSTLTYNSEDKHLGGVTYGGYSESIVVDEAFVLRVPESLSPPAQHRSCARASRPIPRSVTGTSVKARKWVSWGSVASGTWA